MKKADKRKQPKSPEWKENHSKIMKRIAKKKRGAARAARRAVDDVLTISEDRVYAPPGSQIDMPSSAPSQGGLFVIGERDLGALQRQIVSALDAINSLKRIL